MWHKVTMTIFTFININVHWHRIKYFVVLCLSLLLVDLHRNMCFACLVLLVDLYRCMYSHSKSCVCAKHVPFMDRCSIEPKWIYIYIYINLLCGNIYGSIYGQENNMFHLWASVHWHNKSCSMFHIYSIYGQGGCALTQQTTCSMFHILILHWHRCMYWTKMNI